MSMNDNLEVKMAQLTDVIKGLSNTPKLSAGELNEVLNNLVQKIENANDDKAKQIKNEMTITLTDALENKHNEIKERLSVFEDFIASVEKSFTNPKVEGEVTRILNDIEALHSKMRSSELQTESLIKAFDAMKNSASAAQMSKLFDEVSSVSRAYDGIVEVLNGNFKEFLKQIESMTSREDFQRLRFSVENIENGQDVLLSALNTLNEKQEEVKNLVRLSNSMQGSDKTEQLQGILSQMNNIVVDTATKNDLAAITDKITSVTAMLADFRKIFEESSDIGFKNVYQGQLNNIISKLENMRFNTNQNSNEDIMKLYSSIAEFKDGIYSTVNSKLNDVITSMQLQFDKISNSMLTASMDSNEARTNIKTELQKLKNEFDTNFNLKTSDVKEEIKRQSQEGVITAVNAIKGELSRLFVEISSSNSKDKYETLLRSIEQLKSSFDMTSVIASFEQIKAEISLNPLRDDLMRLNKDELLNSIESKIDTILEYKKSDEILFKLDELNKSTNLDNLYKVLDSINQKIDFTTIDTKLANLREFMTSADFTGEISSIREKLSLIDNIGQGLVSVKNIDFVLSEIKAKIEDNFRLNEKKINDDSALQADIKSALTAIYETVNAIPKDQEPVDLEGVENSLNTINENVTLITERLPEVAKENYENIEKVAEVIANKIENTSSKVTTLISTAESNVNIKVDELISRLSSLDLKLNNDDNENNEKFNDVIEKIEMLDEFMKSFSQNLAPEKFAALEKKILTSSDISGRETREILIELQDTFMSNIKAIKTYIMQEQSKPALSEQFIPVFDELEARMADKFVSIETLLEEAQTNQDGKTEEILTRKLAGLREELKNLFSPFSSAINQSIENITTDIVRKYKEELMLDVTDAFKTEMDSLVTFLRDSKESDEKELLSKFVQILSARENSEARVNYVKSVTDTLASILETSTSVKDLTDEFGNHLNTINDTLQKTETKIIETVVNNNNDTEELIDTIKDIIQTTLIENDRFRDFDPEVIINSLNDVMDGNEKISERINEEVSTNISILAETAKNMEVINSNMSDYVAQNNINNEELSELMRRLENCVNENNSNYIDLLNSLKDEIATYDDRTADLIKSTSNEVKENIEELESSIKAVIKENSFDDTKLEDLQSYIKKQAEEVENGIIEAIGADSKLQKKIELILNENKEQIISLIGGFVSKYDEWGGNIKDAIDNKKEEIINTISSRIVNNSDMEGRLNTLFISSNNDLKNTVINAFIASNNDKNEEIRSKFDIISSNVNTNLNDTKQKIADVKIGLDKKLDEAIKEFKDDVEELRAQVKSDITEVAVNVTEAAKNLNTTAENISNKKDDSKDSDKIKEKLSSIEALLNKKMDDTLLKLRADFEEKVYDIQKVIDDKVFDIVNKNNEIIKDELKNQADTIANDVSNEISDKITKMETFISKNSTGNPTLETYTLADVEADIAKIRLSLEKDSKLTNFKEFAARLMELKNINLENSKISRAIGSDIMRFDTWLKNASAKIDLLASKIDKSDKVKIEDLKTRINQTDKSSISPQKVEDAILSIYKKYRTQETKIDDIASKIDTMSQAQAENYDLRQLVDLFYDNSKKQENLISRMDSLEDKMDLIQAKIDHIISSCIDE